MYDIETDIENVATVLHNGHNCMSWKEAQILARAALNASTAVQELRKAEERIKVLEEQIESMHRQYDAVDCFRYILTPPIQKDWHDRT